RPAPRTLRRQGSHVGAGRPRGLPRGRPGLPGWSSGADVPCGHERGQRGRGRRLPGGEDPPHADRRDRPGCRGRARGARIGGVGGQPRAGRLLGPTAGRGDHRGPLTEGWMAGTVAQVAFFVALIVVIVIHEAAHFGVAKWFGIKVEEFFVGFDPPLWWFRGGGCG